MRMWRDLSLPIGHERQVPPGKVNAPSGEAQNASLSRIHSVTVFALSSSSGKPIVKRHPDHETHVWRCSNEK